MDSVFSTILVTAFEPFGGESMNPTERILQALPDAAGGFRLEKLVLPVEFIRAQETAFAAYDALKPRAVIMLGQAGGRSAVTPETTGKNVMNARIPDNAGFQPKGEPVVPGGPEKLPSTLPVEQIVKAVRALDIPCERSEDAGGYVCNALLYGMLNHNQGAVPTGFIHVPYVKEQGHEDKPYIELRTLCRGILAAVETVAAEIRRGTIQEIRCAQGPVIRQRPNEENEFQKKLANRFFTGRKNVLETPSQNLIWDRHWALCLLMDFTKIHFCWKEDGLWGSKAFPGDLFFLCERDYEIPDDFEDGLPGPELIERGTHFRIIPEEEYQEKKALCRPVPGMDNSLWTDAAESFYLLERYCGLADHFLITSDYPFHQPHGA